MKNNKKKIFAVALPLVLSVYRPICPLISKHCDFPIWKEPDFIQTNYRDKAEIQIEREMMAVNHTGSISASAEGLFNSTEFDKFII